MLRPMTTAWFATKGSGTNESHRIEALVSGLQNTAALPFDHTAKAGSFFQLWKAIARLRPALLVMEGTGIAGGLACMLARLLLGTRYVVGSGDAVGPFLSALHPMGTPVFAAYERLLCRLASGYIGWTPYLCGRAMAFGCRRVVTAPGWVIGAGPRAGAREELRARWGIPPDALVVGIVGSLKWNPRHRWCYGMDLIGTVRKLRRTDLCALVVGDGSGIEYLRQAAGDALGRTIFLPGPVELDEVMSALAAMDVGSLPQSVDGVGAYRYTTKLAEYAASGLPVITNRIPVAYDLGESWMWRLGGDSPWDPGYRRELQGFLEALSPEAVLAKRPSLQLLHDLFSKEIQVKRVSAFLQDLLIADQNP